MSLESAGNPGRPINLSEYRGLDVEVVNPLDPSEKEKGFYVQRGKGGVTREEEGVAKDFLKDLEAGRTTHDENDGRSLSDTRQFVMGQLEAERRAGMLSVEELDTRSLGLFMTEVRGFRLSIKKPEDRRLIVSQLDAIARKAGISLRQAQLAMKHAFDTVDEQSKKPN